MAARDETGWAGQLFGWSFKKRPPPPTQESFVPEQNDDGALIVATGGSQGFFVDLDGTVRTEADLIARYRQMAMNPECDRAINEVVNESITIEDGEQTVEIVLDELQMDDNVKAVITEEFKNILNILDFDNSCYAMFRRWYVEGRLYFHTVIDTKRPFDGIKELRYIDPRKIRKIKEVEKKQDPKTNAVIQVPKQEYYIYNEGGLGVAARVNSGMGTTGVKIQADSILHVPSGVTDENGSIGLSYLHFAIKALNQLRQLEDSTLIYYFSRAPERRIFYVDVGGLPPAKAEQQTKRLMNSFKNRLTYNAQTGEIGDDRKFMTFLEDFWFPRRDGRGTEVVPISGGTQLPDLLTAVQYFQDKLYRSLQVPVSRMKPDTLTTLGRATEITREETNFSKFIDRLRMQFAQLFIRALEKQLVLKGVTTPDDWKAIKKYIKFRFLRDNYFAELKEMEIFTDRITRVQLADPYAGKYFSHTWIRREILKQTDEEMAQQDMEIAVDMQNPLYMPTEQFEEEDPPPGPGK